MEGRGKVSHKSLKWGQCACTDAMDVHEALAWQAPSSAPSEWKWSPESAAQGEIQLSCRKCRAPSDRRLSLTRFNESRTVITAYWFCVKQKGQKFHSVTVKLCDWKGLTVIVTLGEIKSLKLQLSDCGGFSFESSQRGGTQDNWQQESNKRVACHRGRELNLLNHFLAYAR